MLFSTRGGQKKGLRRLPGDEATLGADIIPRITSVKRELQQQLVETSVLFQFLKWINQTRGMLSTLRHCCAGAGCTLDVLRVGFSVFNCWGHS